jgi:2-polyprenyl-3-methyl-5-hydroxy-6-metoxy-1,4-benzoquinol methylase
MMNEDFEKLNEETFCLRFELEAMANNLLRQKAERWVPGYVWDTIDVEHKARYHLACQFVRGKSVLDIAGGSGFGAFMLANEGDAKEVTSCDLDSQSVKYSDLKYPSPKIVRSVANAEEYVKKNYFDVIVSFETIEHLPDYKRFIDNVFESLNANGCFIVSTPIVKATRTICENPYHVIEWSFDDFQKILKERFKVESIYLQSIRLEEKEPSIFSRVNNKVRRVLFHKQEVQKPVDPIPVKLNNQYNLQQIISGYQIVVCKK